MEKSKLKRIYFGFVLLKPDLNCKTFKTSLRKITFKLAKELLAENYIP